MAQLVIKRESVRRPGGRRRKSCPFSGPNAPKIDYKDVKLLSAVSAKKQRELTTAIKRARHLALMAYVQG